MGDPQQFVETPEALTSLLPLRDVSIDGCATSADSATTCHDINTGAIATVICDDIGESLGKDGQHCGQSGHGRKLFRRGQPADLLAAIDEAFDVAGTRPTIAMGPGPTVDEKAQLPTWLTPTSPTSSTAPTTSPTSPTSSTSFSAPTSPIAPWRPSLRC